MYGPNEVVRRTGRRWPGELLSQFTQPLAILLAVAAGHPARSRGSRNLICPAKTRRHSTAASPDRFEPNRRTMVISRNRRHPP
ncbi:cation-transporting P-type ATPase [Actinoplanes sp. NPDC049681]|uniref:cation-transporting P-type ATPase n=1 Tax=Actinoplanes sp. NPDC049681 TaxID=3363905 RepID=UPI0037A6367F